MLVIRKEQMDALRADKIRRFANDLSAVIRIKHNRFFRYYSDEQLHVWVMNQIKYLEKYNIDTDDTIKKAIDLLARYGENFERCPDNRWALNILELDDYTASHKISLLVYEAAEQGAV
ncbi:hypothetical protein MNBD_GAMMA08-531 [hydrothermal vent metagenome]|uniref:Uncharacterized protein n=1 Tax=hydrothermal vent metagenome TaxID=652676 RepID=A0A3B0X9T0_9ZZZZ